MSGNDLMSTVDQYRIIEAEAFYASDNLRNLSFAVRTCVVPVWLQRFDQNILNLQHDFSPESAKTLI